MSSSLTATWTTQKTRSGQWPHTLALRRIVVSSSCSPPSCTTHQMSMGRERRVWESGTKSKPLHTISAMLYLQHCTARRVRAVPRKVPGRFEANMLYACACMISLTTRCGLSTMQLEPWTVRGQSG